MLRSKKRTTTFEGPNRSARYTRSEACYVHARVEFARQCAARLLRSGAHVEADAGAGHIHAGYRRTRCPETVCAAARPPVCGQPRYRVTGGGLAVADRAGRHCRSPLRVYTNQISVLLNGFNDNSLLYVRGLSRHEVRTRGPREHEPAPAASPAGGPRWRVYSHHRTGPVTCTICDLPIVLSGHRPRRSTGSTLGASPSRAGGAPRMSHPMNSERAFALLHERLRRILRACHSRARAALWRLSGVRQGP